MAVSPSSAGTRVLLDTHVLVWWMHDPSRLSRHAVSTLQNADNKILVSAAVAWELAIKARIEKITPASLIEDLSRTLRLQSFMELDITVAQAVAAGLLPLHHKDPFDRLLVAQALSLSVPILSADRVLDRYQVERLW
jgi:PIN domain nuclease of toxin-antitoxin system